MSEDFETCYTERGTLYHLRRSDEEVTLCGYPISTVSPERDWEWPHERRTQPCKTCAHVKFASQQPKQ